MRNEDRDSWDHGRGGGSERIEAVQGRAEDCWVGIWLGLGEVKFEKDGEIENNINEERLLEGRVWKGKCRHASRE